MAGGHVGLANIGRTCGVGARSLTDRDRGTASADDLPALPAARRALAFFSM